MVVLSSLRFCKEKKNQNKKCQQPQSETTFRTFGRPFNACRSPGADCTADSGTGEETRRETS